MNTRLIFLGERALREVVEDPHGPNESSLVFEDAFREYAPEQAYLADYLRESRGFSTERLHLRQMIEYLQDEDIRRHVEHVRPRVTRILSAAVKRGLIHQGNEHNMRILFDLEAWIRYGAKTQASKRGFREEVYRAFGFPNDPALTRLAQRVADAMYAS